MKRELHNITIAIGVVVLCAAIFGFGVDENGFFHIPSDRLALALIAPIVAIMCGGICDIFINSVKEVQIEAKDERNIIIAKYAQAFGFKIMSILLSSTILILVLIGYISITIFLIFFAIYATSQLAYFFRLSSLRKTM